MWAQFLLLASIGALIGWMTNVIAIKLLFKPINPIKIPLLGFTFQGLIPKRRAEIAKQIGETVERELLSIEEIMDTLIERTDKTEVIQLMQTYIVKIVSEKMPAMVPGMFKGMIVNYIGEVIAEEGESILTELTEKVIHHATEKINISQMVEDKINAFPLEELERLTIEIAKKELKHIEYLGGLIGFFIGNILWFLINAL